ncbi:MAG TPA: hypothetical protein VLU94_01250 [Candidatus Nitrosotalea sp.]|nr:hypothetical protein [Candidatus Nitrosotalea sp.]
MKPLVKPLLILLLAGCAAGIFLQRRAISQARRENQNWRSENRLVEKLSRENAGIEQLQRENEEIAELRSGNRELYQLRNEVRELREQTRPLSDLRIENERLRSALGSEVAGGTDKPGQTVILSKDSLKFSGYATPDATLQTMFWSMSQGDVQSLIKCFPPDIQARMEELKSAGRQGRISLNAEEMKQEFETFKSFRIAARKSTSDTTMLLGLQLNVDGATEPDETGLPFRLVGGEWKIDLPP